MESRFTVFVDGAEVADHALSEAQADRLVQLYLEDGYDTAQKVEIDSTYLRLAYAIIKKEEK